MVFASGTASYPTVIRLIVCKQYSLAGGQILHLVCADPVGLCRPHSIPARPIKNLESLQARHPWRAKQPRTFTRDSIQKHRLLPNGRGKVRAWVRVGWYLDKPTGCTHRVPHMGVRKLTRHIRYIWVISFRIRFTYVSGISGRYISCFAQPF